MNTKIWMKPRNRWIESLELYRWSLGDGWIERGVAWIIIDTLYHKDEAFSDFHVVGGHDSKRFGA